MKKILLILLLILPLFIASGCKQEYNGKTIISIEYITKDYNGGYTNKRKIDFVNDKVYGLGFLPVSDKVPDYTELFSIDNSKEKDFINEIYNLGLLTLKKSYKRIIPVIDGGGWDLIITYEDGSTKKSSGDNAGPYKTFTKCDEVFYEYYNESFFGRVSLDNTVPNLGVAFTHSKNNGLYSLSTSLSPSNYKLNNKEVNNINNFEFAKEQYYITFEKNTSYSISVSNEKQKIKNITLKCYNKTLDFEGIINPKENKYNYEYPLLFNKLYVFEITLKDGYIEYPLSTLEETYEKLPSDFSFTISIKEDKKVKKFDSKFSVLSNGINSIHFELSDDILLDLYKQIDQNNFFDLDFRYGNGMGDSNYVSMNVFYKNLGKTVTIYDKYATEEATKLYNIINDIYNKHLKEVVDNIPLEPYTLEVNKIYVSQDQKVYLTIYENEQFILTADNKNYRGNYIISGNKLFLVTDDGWYHYDFIISDGYLILDKYRTNIAYQENKYFYQGIVYNKTNS